jgi:hypothetical protein
MSTRHAILAALALGAMPVVACLQSDDSANSLPADAGPILVGHDGSFPSDAAYVDATRPDGTTDEASVDASPTEDASVEAASQDASVDAPADVPFDVSSFDAPATPCGAYCATIMTYCTGTNAQYPSFDSCLGACAPLPPGNVSDTSGDTLGCRGHFAALAQSSPATACANAGPTGGGDVSGDGGDSGTVGACGDACEAFCTITQAVCNGTNKQFADIPTCMSYCATFTPTQLPPFSTGDTTLSDFGCHVNQLLFASAGGATLSTDCARILGNSRLCAFALSAKIDGASVIFDANMSIASKTGVLTVQGDDNPTSTHWTLQVVLTATPPSGGQVTCATGSSNPSINYTHYTNGVADEVYSTTVGAGACSIFNITEPVTAGDPASGNFNATVVRNADAGGGNHVVTVGSYSAVL